MLKKIICLSFTLCGFVNASDSNDLSKPSFNYDISFPSSGASGQVNQAGFIVYFPGDFFLRTDLMAKNAKQ